MNVTYIEEDSVKTERFRRLTSWYILALSAIAIVAIVGQLLIQRHLKKQESDSRTINVAGRQRMLSQKITKIALLITSNQTAYSHQQLNNDLTNALHLWKISQHGLMNGNDSLGLSGNNSETVIKMFEQVNIHFNSIYESANHLLNTKTDSQIQEAANTDVMTILKQEPLFLSGMNDIAFQYDDEAHARVTRLRNLEYLLMAITITVILLELFFIFKPTAEHVNRTIAKLITSEKNQKRLAKEIGALYSSLEVSYQQLSHISQPTETPRLFARADRGGNLLSIAPAYTELTGKSIVSPGMQIKDLFDFHDKGVDWMDVIVDTVSNGETREELVKFKILPSQVCWVNIQITPLYNGSGEIYEWIITGSDVTDQKTAEGKMNKKTRDEIEKKINAQKFRSVLILEGQEEERKRIAMDIHDGIGQMLTSLKFQIETLSSSEPENLIQKIDEVKTLISQIIKEVRKVTFNLNPTVLGDYGLEAALKLFVTEISKLTEVDMSFEARGEATYRLPQKLENNVFRIVQEALNNSIKYSKAQKIELILQWSSDSLMVTVKDNGQGFEEKILKERSNNIESGRGFFNMYERTEYINGVLDIKSSPGIGTTVVLVMPLHRNVKSDLTQEQLA